MLGASVPALKGERMRQLEGGNLMKKVLSFKISSTLLLKQNLIIISALVPLEPMNRFMWNIYFVLR